MNSKLRIDEYDGITGWKPVLPQEEDHMLAQAGVDDVFKAMHDSLDEGPSSGRTLALIGLSVGLLLVLVIIQYYRKRQATPRIINNPRRLTREAGGAVQLDREELAQLARSAEQAGVQNPLTLLICPSLLGKAMAGTSGAERERLVGIVRKLEET